MKRFTTQLNQTLRAFLLLLISCFGFLTATAGTTGGDPSSGSDCNLQLIYGTRHISCFGAVDGTLTVAVRNGTAPYKYRWSTGATTRNITGLKAGWYYITATDSKGCSITDSVEIMEPTQLKAVAKIMNEAGCGSSDGTVSLEALGGTPPFAYYLGTEMNRTGVFENIPAGKLQYFIVDARACISATGEIELKGAAPLNVEVDIRNISCKGSDGAVKLMASGGTAPFTYTCGAASNNTGEFTGLSEGSYTYKVIDSKGCEGVGVFQLAAPAPLSIDAAVTSAVTCKGGDGTIKIIASGNPPFTFVLNGNTNNTGVFGKLAAGKHNYKVIDSKGCEGTGSIDLVQPSTDLAASSVITSEVSCAGEDGEVRITATGGKAPYLFHLGGKTTKNGVFTGLKPVKYFYKIADANGCVIPATVQLKAPKQVTARVQVQGLVISYAGTYFVYPGFGLNTVRLTALGSGGSGNYTYDWGIYGKSVTVTVRPKVTTTYPVTITDSKGCKKTASVTIVAIAPGCCDDFFAPVPNGTVDEAVATGLDVLRFPSLKVYPNPASEYINVGLDQLATINGKSEISIFDLQGRLITNRQLNKSSINRIDVSQLKQGMYILHLKVAGQLIKTSKFNIVR